MLISRTRIGGVVFLLLCLSVMPMTASAAKFKVKDGPTLDIFAFGQFGFEQYDRNNSRDKLEFDADRVRFGTKVKWGAWDGGFQFDAKGSGSNSTSLPKLIRDAFIRYKFSNAAQLKVGQYKSPVGMGFNISGTKLPLIKRTMASRLVLDRTLGAMLSGRNMGGSKETGGFGYDFGVFNSADRSQAANIDSSQKGDSLSYAARVMYDFGKMLHLEASYGEIENAGGLDLTDPEEDYQVWNAGAIYKNGPVHLRAEYIDGEDVDGVEGFDEQSWYVMGAYRFTDMVEGVVRYQDAECDNCGNRNTDQDLDRLEVGLNFFLGPNDRMGRFQVNYVSVGGDEEGYSGKAGGGDNKFDAILGQLQLHF